MQIRSKISVICVLVFLSLGVSFGETQLELDSSGMGRGSADIVSDGTGRPGVEVDLKDLLKGAKNSYSLRAQNLLVLQAEEESAFAKAKFAPSLNLTYSYDYKYSDGDKISDQHLIVSTGMNLFSGFSTVNGVLEKQALVDKSIYDERQSQEMLFLQIVQQYYIYFNSMSKLASLEQKLKQIKSDMDRVKSLHTQGLNTSDVKESIKAQSALTEYQISDAKFSIRKAKLTLEYLSNTKFGSLKRVKLKDPIFIVNDKSDIRALEYQILSQRYAGAQLNYYPSVDIKSSYSYLLHSSSKVTKPAIPYLPEGAFSSPKDVGLVSLTITFPLLDKVTMSFKKQSIRLAQMASENILASKKLEQQKDERLHREGLTLAKEQLLSAEAGLVSADAYYKNIKRRYDANLITFTEYLYSLSAKYDSESNYIQALNNYELQKASYIFHSGQKLEDYVI